MKQNLGGFIWDISKSNGLIKSQVICWCFYKMDKWLALLYIIWWCKMRKKTQVKSALLGIFQVVFLLVHLSPLLETAEHLLVNKPLLLYTQKKKRLRGRKMKSEHRGKREIFQLAALWTKGEAQAWLKSTFTASQWILLPICHCHLGEQ